MYPIITLPTVQVRLDSGKFSFTINNMKASEPSIVGVTIHCLNYKQKEIETYHNRWVVDTEYQTFTFNQSVQDKENIAFITTDIEFYNVTSEKPVWFYGIMLQDGEFTEYHSYNEERGELSIGFNENNYANLYEEDDAFLQVIRLTGDAITTNTIPKSVSTILAPHLPNETSFDDPINIFYEAITQKEQVIDIER